MHDTNLIWLDNSTSQFATLHPAPAFAIMFTAHICLCAVIAVIAMPFVYATGLPSGITGLCFAGFLLLMVAWVVTWMFHVARELGLIDEDEAL